jgi:hypothetical protein
MINVYLILGKLQFNSKKQKSSGGERLNGQDTGQVSSPEDTLQETRRIDIILDKLEGRINSLYIEM